MEKIPERIAHTVVVDHAQGALFIEGVQMPFAVAQNIEVGDIEGYVGTVTLTLYADEVTVISKGGERSTIKAHTHEHALEWARREARRIVHEGMADVLEWLWTSSATAEKALERFPARHILGLAPKEREALVSQTTHSEEWQEKGEQA